MAKACSLEASKMKASGMEKKFPTEEANLFSQKQQSKADRQSRNSAVYYGYLQSTMATCSLLRLPAAYYGYL